MTRAKVEPQYEEPIVCHYNINGGHQEVHILFPILTPEEKEEGLRELEATVSRILKKKVTARYVK